MLYLCATQMWCLMIIISSCHPCKIHVKGGDGSPITYDRKQGHRKKAREVSHGPAENFKPRFLLPPSAEFAICYNNNKKNPFWERLTQFQILFQDILGAETSISNLAVRSVILIRPFPSEGWGLCWLNFIRESVGGQYTRSSEVRSIQNKPPRGSWLSFCEISYISSSS